MVDLVREAHNDGAFEHTLPSNTSEYRNLWLDGGGTYLTSDHSVTIIIMTDDCINEIVISTAP